MIYNMHVFIYVYVYITMLTNSNKLAATRNEPSPNWPYFKCELITAVIEGSLEVKLPTIWTDEKQSRAEAERRERLEERRSEEKESEERRCRCAKR